MKVYPINDSFHRDIAEKYEADEYKDCPICGKPVRWPWETVAWDKNNQIFHAKCVEEENYGRKRHY